MDYSTSKKLVMNQLVRSTTSVSANYGAACRAESDKEFTAKLNTVLEEIDECRFWLKINQTEKYYAIETYLKKANECTAILVSSLKTLNKKLLNSNILTLNSKV